MDTILQGLPNIICYSDDMVSEIGEAIRFQSLKDVSTDRLKTFLPFYAKTALLLQEKFSFNLDLSEGSREKEEHTALPT